MAPVRPLLAPVRPLLSTKHTVMQHWRGTIRQSGNKVREVCSVFTLYVEGMMILESGINMDIQSLREYAYLNKCGKIVVRQTL